MSRIYPTAEAYEARQRGYEEVRPEFPRAPARRLPDFLRDDHGRTSAGPLAIRERVNSDDFDRYTKTKREVEKDEVVFRDRRALPPREIEREEVVFRARDREPQRPRSVAPAREVERDEVIIRREEEERRPRNAGREIRFRRGQSRPREIEREKEEVVIRRDEREERSKNRETETIVIRPREKSLPPQRELVAREREELVVKRREPPPLREEKEQIIIRRTEQRSPTPPPPPPPPPEPEPIIKPAIHQEVITHHRTIDHGMAPPPEPEPIVRPPIHQEIITHHIHIDHGVERAHSPTPPPLPPSPPPPTREEELEIAIRRRGTGKLYDEDIIYEREVRERKERDREIDISHRRSLSAPRQWDDRKDMWTEITKDLVIKEAIETFGYDYEETESYFYVMEYLRYEDVVRLVELSDDIREDRQARLREIEWERDELNNHRERRPNHEDRLYEREVIYDSRRTRR